MTGFNYLINLTVVNGGAFGKLASMAGGFENSLDRVQGEVGQTEKKLKNLGQTGSKVFGGMRTSVMGWVAGLGIGAAALGSLTTAADLRGFEKAITFTGGADGAKNLEVVDETIKRLKLNAQATYEGFNTLSGGFMGSSSSGQTMLDLFQGMSEGATVLQLKSDKLNNAFVALGQMAGKPVLSMEELKLQLQDAFPPAMSIAAKAMDMPIGKFTELVGKGKIVTEEFLPKFAAELRKTFGPAVADAVKGPRASFNEFGNSIMRLKDMIGTQLMPTAIALINDVFVPMVGWVGRNVETLKFLGIVIGGVWAAFKFYNIWVATASLVTGGLTASVTALSAAMWANPIGLIIAAVIAVGAAVYYAWNHFEGFRGAVYGVWEVIKPVASFLYDVFTAQFRALGAVMQWVWEKTESLRAGFGQWMDSLKGIGTWIWENLIKPFSMVGRVVSLLEPLFSKAGVSIGKNFTEGWNKGVGEIMGDSPTPGGALGAAGFSAPGAGLGSGVSTGSGAGKASKISDNITNGGQRNVTINVGKLNEGGITINTTNLKEGSTEVEAMLMKLMLQVVNSGNQQQGK